MYQFLQSTVRVKLCSEVEDQHVGWYHTKAVEVMSLGLMKV
jgi:hypothetical protein